MAGYQQVSDDLFGDDGGFDAMDLFGDNDNDNNDFLDANNAPVDSGADGSAMEDLPSFADSFQNNDLAEHDDELAAVLGGQSLDNVLKDAHERELDKGEKADDAVDYEDFDDDDLPDEEEATGQSQPSYKLAGIEDAAATADDGADDDDLNDLFEDGDVDMGSFIAAPASLAGADAAGTPMAADEDGDKDSLASEHDDAMGLSQLPDDLADTEDIKLYLLQKALFESGAAPETQEENLDEWVRTEFPNYDKNELPYFNRLFPPQPAHWTPAWYKQGKDPVKPPKPLRPTKVTLDIEPDHRFLFNSVGTTGHVEPRKDLVHILRPEQARDSDDSDDESNDDEPLPGGYTMQDLEFFCADFDTLSHADGSEDGFGGIQVRIADLHEAIDSGDFDDAEHVHKKRKTGYTPQDIINLHQINFRSLDNPERKVAKLATKTVLDFNDPQLLVEEIDPETAKLKVKPGLKDRGPQSVASKLSQRFQTSNDNEYDALEMNAKRGSRGQLGHNTVDHSLPALRLQYPYFPVQRTVPELRNWHRKKMLFKAPFTFVKPTKQKRKAFKGRPTKEIYSKTKDLSLGDNSTAVIFEYSEEHPLMLSSIGMGNSVINYYRKKTSDDTHRPKHEIGELNVLLNEDRSPFNDFGQVEPGQEVTTLLNSMYRAPLFKQSLKSQDFLILRETTGLEGQKYYIRNVDSSFVVGQELPIMKVPGVHSRNVTSASKYRLRAIAYRLARRKKNNRIRVEDVTRHFPESTDMQNRQKMKEFMSYNKEWKEWEMAKGHDLHTEEQIQDLLKPEEIALLEAKDVGAQYLRDVGFADDDGDDDEERVGEPFEQAMAPWKITKNFALAAEARAMLILFGDGDPSGRGEAISFLKTSMKGGFKTMGGAINDTVLSKRELGGHQYNVAKQESEYKEALRKIWKKQSDALSSREPPTDPALEGDVDTQEDNMLRQGMRAPSMSTPGPGRRMDDETGTSFSRRSGTSQQGQRFLKITRKVFVNGEARDQSIVESNPAVIKAYIKRKELHAAANIEYGNSCLVLNSPLTYDSITQIGLPTGHVETDAKNQERYLYNPYSLFSLTDLLTKPDFKPSSPVSKRTKHATRNAPPRNKKPTAMAATQAKTAQCLPAARPPLQARNPNRPSESARIVVKSVTSRPTKSMCMTPNAENVVSACCTTNRLQPVSQSRPLALCPDQLSLSVLGAHRESVRSIELHVLRDQS